MKLTRIGAFIWLLGRFSVYSCTFIVFIVCIFVKDSEAQSSVCQEAVCYRGGIASSDARCVRSSGNCPPCLTGSNDPSCFALVGDKCPFGTDCRGEVVQNTEPPASVDTTTDAPKGNDKTIEKEDTNVEDSEEDDVTSREQQKSSSSELPIILGIAGGLVAMIAVVGALFMLVKRGNDYHSDDDNAHFVPHVGSHVSQNSVRNPSFDRARPTAASQPYNTEKMPSAAYRQHAISNPGEQVYYTNSSSEYRASAIPRPTASTQSSSISTKPPATAIDDRSNPSDRNSEHRESFEF